MVDVAVAGIAVAYIRSTGEVQIVWAKAGCGIWGLGHVFKGELYFTKDIVDDSFVPRNRKPKSIPKPEAKPAPNPAPKGKPPCPST